jgi:hypothetical protein
MPYRFTGGAAYIEARKIRGEKAKLAALIEWHTIVVRDGIDPQVAHNEFLKIDEYRDALPPDIRGAAPGSGWG